MKFLITMLLAMLYVQNGCSSSGDDDSTETPTSYPDRDIDGDGYTPNEGDCDDYDAGVHPGLYEACDGVDQDCDGEVDEGDPAVVWCEDADFDGWGDEGTCAHTCGPGPGLVAMDPEDAEDCDAGDPAVNPGAEEVCDLEDNDCDEATDEYVKVQSWRDGDEDTWGVYTEGRSDCVVPDGYATRFGDCDDGNPAVNPDAEDPPGDDKDTNCDGQDLVSGEGAGR